jgi:hypothetical protein
MCESSIKMGVSPFAFQPQTPKGALKCAIQSPFRGLGQGHLPDNCPEAVWPVHAISLLNIKGFVEFLQVGSGPVCTEHIR